MNKLDKEHLHLLFDEPIYVLADHGDHPQESETETADVSFSGLNKRGVCIFAGDSDEDDIEFLFKGLNALGINHDDIALYGTNYESAKDYPTHSKRLTFSEKVKTENAFDVQMKNDIVLLNTLPLREIRNNLEFKKGFWVALKAIFN